MSDCPTDAFKRPTWGGTEWKTLPNGGEVHGPAEVDLHAIEVELSDGTERTKLLPLAQGVAVVGMKLDGKRWASVGGRDWDAEGWDE